MAAAVESVRELSEKLWPDLMRRLESCVRTMRLRSPQTLAGHGSLITCLEAANRLFEFYRPGIYELALSELSGSLGPSRTGIGALWASLTNSRYRRAKRKLLSVRVKKASGAQLLRELGIAQRLLAGWREIAEPGSSPGPCPEAALLRVADGKVRAALETLSSFVDLPLASAPVFEVVDLVTRLAADRQTPTKIPALRSYEREITSLGAAAFLEELRVTKSAIEWWIPNLRYAWLASCMDQLLLEEPEFAVFNGREHDKSVQDFKDLDRTRLDVAIQRVRRAYGESAVAAANRNRDQNLLVRRQAALRTRHLPFRELMRRAPDAVAAVKPCWMASPLAVSQVLGGTQQQYFDVVIFDEASQVLPEDAVTSILRGRSLVVAGDPDQLPPTQFFAAEREDDDSGPEEDMAGFESILNAMIAFLPQWSLNWHYRSRDERLIAFSNHYVYGDRLVTFPSVGSDRPALTHVLVPQLRLGDTEELSSSAEVTKVVELILEHAEKQPQTSLGVIAMGIRHSNRLEAELARARRARPDLDPFFDEHKKEKFFIKNLERVQGDERDAVILSIGYGKDAGGKLPYRFGPLLSEGGYRRLNVAITRAKHWVTLVSSFSHHDMDPARSNRRGVELLRLYLEYAASGGDVFGDGGPAPVERNEFEIQVQAALEHAGLKVIPQYGASRYRIDLVVQHPEQLGRCLLAVECDGATYHSSPTARDRDRLRQEHLEARGWRFVRIWSTDWITRRQEEIGRVMDAYHRELGRDPDGDGSLAGDDPAETPKAVHQLSQLGVPTRSPRPNVLRGLPITSYASRDLIAVARWIRSDGLLRTDDEMVEAMVEELGFERRGRWIEAALRQAIQSTRPGPSSPDTA